MKGKLENPLFVITLMTTLMALPFIAFLLDRFLLKLNNSFLFFAEITILSLGISSGVIIFLFLIGGRKR
ncbi:hypothetical protein JCM14244_08530 [Venenivibrio stagnispumantis]|uniref:Uncharacterized protein n=1 Tax=Venenivibrio stagnispumantis TaxID=407998 RepID=A0AA45WLQ9_9AQUI|nr:hypothetical protein [Venenivibrio stagnispumantis]MCW4573449.1 hypothetical protein [Venenivibrio stagnispumantis]SMP11846.1 hypothetical protein SAMN06264868_10911 [Venenivibrio stagnispumantis]